MALWNDKRTPPGVFTDTRSGQNGTISPNTGSWKNRTDREPTVEESFNRPKAPSWQTRTDREPTIYEKPQKAPKPNPVPAPFAGTRPNGGFHSYDDAHRDVYRPPTTKPKASPVRMRALANVDNQNPLKAAGANPKPKAVPGVSGVSKSPIKPGTYAPARGKKVAVKPPRR